MNLIYDVGNLKKVRCIVILIEIGIRETTHEGVFIKHGTFFNIFYISYVSCVRRKMRDQTLVKHYTCYRRAERDSNLFGGIASSVRLNDAPLQQSINLK
jgi:hypothetical protein